MKKICFAILVHEKREVIIDLIENIHYFCPNASIVLFQSGNDPNLCKGLGYPVCPSSHQMVWGRTFSWFFLNVMQWLEEIEYDYDYLINIDSDALFAKKGFEELILSHMENIDYMASSFMIPTDEWTPGHTMDKVWQIWQPIFGLNHFYKCFGSQVFSRSFVKQIISFEKLNEMKKIMKQTENDIFALEEMLFATLSKTLGVKSKRFPSEVEKWIRDTPFYSENEIKNAVSKDEECFLIHPVRRNINDAARKFIRNLIR